MFGTCLFSEMLKSSRGVYTDKQVSRASKMCGAFGKEVQRLFHASLGDGLEYQTTRKQPARYGKDILALVNDLQKEALFDYLPPREHSGFQQFVHTNKIKSPLKMGRRIHELNVDMDFWNRRTNRKN